MATMTVTVGDETIAVEDRGVTAAPAVKFVTKRQYGLRQEQAAHMATGRNIKTGRLTLAVGVRNRPNGLVRFDADLFKLPLDLHPDAIARLYRYWHDLNADYSLPKKMLRRMDCHFSRNTVIFDATSEQAEHWREFLREVLTDVTSYRDMQRLTGKRP